MPIAVPTYLNGRHLTPSEREQMLKQPDETWITFDELAEMRARGERDLEIAEAIWHGEFGSKRLPWEKNDDTK